MARASVVGVGTERSVAGALADRANGALLSVLLDGRARTAHELARATGVPVAATKERLDALEDGGFLRARRSGGRGYWQLADAEVAHTLRKHGLTAREDAARKRWNAPRTAPLSNARSCYAHLAGALGVAQLRTLERRCVVRASGTELALTDHGRQWLARRGIGLSAGVACRPCLDASERRDHLGGALGKALLAYERRRGWLEPGRVPRALVLTARGRREFLPWLRGAAAWPL